MALGVLEMSSENVANVIRRLGSVRLIVDGEVIFSHRNRLPYFTPRSVLET